MATNPWIDLLGCTTEDSALRAALAEVGIKKIPKIKRDELDVRIEVGDTLMFIITDGEIFPELVEGDGVHVFTGVFFRIDPKASPGSQTLLPYEIAATDSREKLRARFGEPIEGERYRADEWAVDERRLWVDYDDSFTRVESVGIMIPEPE